MSLSQSLPERFLLSGWPRLACAASLLLLILGKTEGRARRYYFHRMICQLHKEGLRKGIGSEIPVYVINRKCDEGRLGSFLQAAYRHGIRPERIEALDAKDPNFDWGPHDSWIADTFYKSEWFRKGELGCFLSHVAVWKNIAQGQAEGALICEDDATLLAPLPSKWRDWGVPKDADFVFCNTKMSESLFQKHHLLTRGGKFKYFAVAEVLQERFKTGMAMRGPGTDCYIITKRCAAKIIEQKNHHRFRLETDWQIILSSLSNKEKTTIFQLEGSNRFLDVLKLTKKHFNSYVMLPPLAAVSGSGTTIEKSNPDLCIKRSEISEAADQKTA